jgi:hypothetical protein
MSAAGLEVLIYQIADDSMLKKNRADGTGWDWRWADWKRDWMDATHQGFAYRCLPLTIMNQIGWQVLNPVTFEALWDGRPDPGGVTFKFFSEDPVWPAWINNHFGQGVITWNTPFLWKTRPIGSRLLVMGPPNYFKPNVHALTALIESDWMNMSFTMNWKIGWPGQPVRFEAGEPLFQVIPIAGNICGDLEKASVVYKKLQDEPEVWKQYTAWQAGRNAFHEKKREGQVKPEAWQRNYFQGKDAAGKEAAAEHYTKIVPPVVRHE